MEVDNMDFNLSDILLFILNVCGNLIGLAIAIAIAVAILKFTFSVVQELLSYSWKAIHKPSFDKFQNKLKQRKAKK
jgi:uncharacterized membrane protein (DUF485 family)